MTSDPAAAPASALFVARASFVVLMVTFIGLLGGFHPSDRRRDIALLVAAILVVAMNAPLAAWIGRNLLAPDPERIGRRRAAIMAGVALVLRLAFAAWLLRFIGSISHEGRS